MKFLRSRTLLFSIVFVCVAGAGTEAAPQDEPQIAKNLPITTQVAAETKKVSDASEPDHSSSNVNRVGVQTAQQRPAGALPDGLPAPGLGRRRALTSRAVR